MEADNIIEHKENADKINENADSLGLPAINVEDSLGLPTINVEDSDTEESLLEIEKKQENSNIGNDDAEGNVTLRRNAQAPKNSLPTIMEDEYRYTNYTNRQSRIPTISRRKLELGSEKAISNDDLRLAATLVSDAMEGRTVEFKTQPKYVKSYNWYKSWPLTYLLYFFIMLDVSLIIVEHPAVEMLALDYWVTIPVEILCLMYFAFRTYHHACWRRKDLFLKDKKNIFVISIIVITAIDIIVYVSMKQSAFKGPTVRYSRFLRAFLVVNFSDGRQIRRAWRNIRRTIKEIAHVILLFFFFVFVFALVAYELFYNRYDIVYPNNEPYFKDYMDSFWDLYILVTTANNPDVMMPAYEKSRYYCIFFFVYVMICFYMLLNVFLAVAYHSYTENMKNEIKRSCREKKKKLVQAFDVLKVNFKGKDMMTYRTWKRLMRLTNSDLNKNQIDLLMLILDMDRSGHIGRKEFMNVADLLNVPLSEVKDRITWLESHLPRMYNSFPSDCLKTFVNSIFFKLLYDAIVVAHVFLIAFFVPHVNIPFYCLFLLEILLKIYTHGLSQYKDKLSNWFDIVVTALSTIFIIANILITESDVRHLKILQSLQVINIVRIFRILRLLVHIQRFKIITNTIVNISLSIVMYCGIIFMIFYVFALLGMEIYQGRIHYYGYENITNVTEMYCGDVRLNGSYFYESRYCSINFNDFFSSMMVLATLLFENNWHILAEGYVKVTNKWTRLYFGAFYTCVVVVIMNIVTAFIVDMFMYEYTIQMQGKVDSAVEKKIKELGLGIDPETGLEVSEPMSDEQLKEIMQKEGKDIQIPQHGDQLKELLKKDGKNIQIPQHAWKDKFESFKKAENRLSRIGTYVKNRRSSIAPSLTRFDGIRFHIKKTGWTKIEVLLQQLYEAEGDDEDIDVTLNFNETRSNDRARSMMI